MRLLRSNASRLNRFYWESGIADDVPALAYAFTICLVPLMLGISTITALMLAGDKSPGEIALEIGQALPASTSKTIVDVVVSTKNSSPQLIVVAALLMFWTASSAVGIVERCLSRLIGRNRRVSPLGRRFHHVWLAAVVSILICLIAFGVTVSNGYLDHVVHLPSKLMTYPLLFGCQFLAAAIVFKFAPYGGIHWRSALTGSLVTSSLLLIVPTIVKIYSSTLGGASPTTVFFVMAIALLSCYLMALFVLIGVGVSAAVEQKEMTN